MMNDSHQALQSIGNTCEIELGEGDRYPPTNNRVHMYHSLMWASRYPDTKQLDTRQPLPNSLKSTVHTAPRLLQWYV